MPVLERSSLVDSPLADLHAIASELSIDGYRRLRREALIDAILERQGGEASTAAGSEDGESTTRRRRSRGGRGRARSTDAETEKEGESAASDAAQSSDDAEEPAPRSRRSRSRVKAKSPTDDIDAETAGAETEAEAERTETQEPARPARARRGRSRTAEEPAETTGRESGEDAVEGVVEVLPGGSGFVRVGGEEPSDDDVYISAAQVKRCELVSGDRVSGPRRAPRRSERFASLVRVETINGRPASEVAEGTRFDDLPASPPTQRIEIGAQDDPTLEAIEWLVPFGRGSRVTITGPARAGKTEVLRRLAAALRDADGLTVSLVLAGVRPEESADWPLEPVAVVSLAESEEAQASALESAVDQARRLAARGEHALLLIDGLDGLAPAAARRLMASARCIVDGGSLTIVATAGAPVGGETTSVVLDRELTSIGRFPNIDLLASGTLHPERLLGEDGAELIARTRAELLGEGED